MKKSHNIPLRKMVAHSRVLEQYLWIQQGKGFLFYIQWNILKMCLHPVPTTNQGLPEPIVNFEHCIEVFTAPAPLNSLK